MVNSTDAAGSLAEDMRQFVQLAASMDIMIVWCLWNGAVLRDARTISMIVDPSGVALKSFVDRALTPLVTALKSEPGIGAWEIINEPEGSVASNVPDTEPCWDTTKLKGTGAGWAQQPGAKGKSGIGQPLPMKYLQRFVAVQAAAIHAADPGALVTVGSWNVVANTNADGHRNYWSDSCLQKASNLRELLGLQAATASHATLDFYQIHSCTMRHSLSPLQIVTVAYMRGCLAADPSGGAFNGESPVTGLNKTHFGLTKPLVIGEFPADALNGGLTDTQLYQYAYAAGFDGAWGWALNANAKNDATLLAGMQSIRHNRGVVITVGANTYPPKDGCPPAPPMQPIPVQPKPACSDKAPPGQYTCAQQKSWGKCSADFMHGFCCETCWGCAGVLQCGGP
jgi:hypothetical protein